MPDTKMASRVRKLPKKEPMSIERGVLAEPKQPTAAPAQPAESSAPVIPHEAAPGIGGFPGITRDQSKMMEGKADDAFKKEIRDRAHKSLVKLDSIADERAAIRGKKRTTGDKVADMLEAGFAPERYAVRKEMERRKSEGMIRQLDNEALINMQMLKYAAGDIDAFGNNTPGAGQDPIAQRQMDDDLREAGVDIYDPSTGQRRSTQELDAAHAKYKREQREQEAAEQRRQEQWDALQQEYNAITDEYPELGRKIPEDVEGFDTMMVDLRQDAGQLRQKAGVHESLEKEVAKLTDWGAQVKRNPATGDIDEQLTQNSINTAQERQVREISRREREKQGLMASMGMPPSPALEGEDPKLYEMLMQRYRDWVDEKQAKEKEQEQRLKQMEASTAFTWTRRDFLDEQRFGTGHYQAMLQEQQDIAKWIGDLEYTIQREVEERTPSWMNPMEWGWEPTDDAMISMEMENLERAKKIQEQHNVQMKQAEEAMRTRGLLPEKGAHQKPPENEPDLKGGSKRKDSAGEGSVRVEFPTGYRSDDGYILQQAEAEEVGQALVEAWIEKHGEPPSEEEFMDAMDRQTRLRGEKRGKSRSEPE